MAKLKSRKETYIGTMEQNWKVEKTGCFVVFPALNVSESTGNYSKTKSRIKVILKEIPRRPNVRKPKGYWKKYNQRPKRATYRRKYQIRQSIAKETAVDPRLLGQKAKQEDRSWPACRY